MTNKRFAALLAGIMLTAAIPVETLPQIPAVLTAFAEETAERTVVKTGRPGADARYVFYDDGTMEITGTGRLIGYADSIKGDIKTVIIHEGITYINDMFKNAPNITSVTLPSTLEDMYAKAFLGTPWFEAQRDSSGLVIIGDMLIDASRCGSSVTVPEGVRLICSSAFERTNVSAVTLPSTLTTIGSNAFANCGRLTGIVIPEGVTSIGNSAFSYTGLRSIELPDSVTTLGGAAFSMCTALRSIRLSAGLTVISNGMFHGCTSMQELVIPDGVKTIEDMAFYNCSSLRNITFPPSVEEFGLWMFIFVPWLEDRRAEDPLVIVNQVVIDGQTCTGDVVVPEGVKTILCEAFIGSELTGITLPESLRSIEFRAFMNAASLTAIDIPEGVEVLENSTFCGCTSLSSVTIPASVNEISHSVFDDTAWLQERQAEDPLVVVNGILIDGTTCSGTVSLPRNIRVVNTHAFNGSQVRDVVIPENVESVGLSAFCNCSQLKSVTILNPACEIFMQQGYNYRGNFCNQDMSAGYTGEERFPYKGVLRGYEGSTLQAYAEECGRTFEPFSGLVPGDADLDGTVSVQDAVLVQKWLLGKASLPYWENVDLSGDQTPDIFDLCLLKRMLLSK